MKMRVFFAMMALGLFPAVVLGVDMSAPSGGLGSAGNYGHLQFWNEVKGVSFDVTRDEPLELRFRFTSDPAVGGILGAGFFCPMFEAKAYLIRETMLRAYLPCGMTLYLRRNAKDVSRFQMDDGGWSGVVTGEDFTMSTKDGWRMVYHKGRLVTMSVNGRTFEWKYDSQGMPLSVSEDGRELITVKSDGKGHATAFVFQGKTYTVEYADRPLTEMVKGLPVVRQQVTALHSLTYPDGKKEIFDFGLTKEKVPSLTLTRPDQKEPTVYTWDAGTGYILSEKGPEGEWKYKVGEVTKPFEIPAISRTSPDGKMEGVAIDLRAGIYTQILDKDTSLVTHTFTAPGPLQGAVSYVEKVHDGVSTIAEKYTYDEKSGRQLSTMDQNGIIQTWKYNAAGQRTGAQISLSDDPSLHAKLAAKEQELLDKLKKATDPNVRCGVLHDLLIFYTCDSIEYDKARKLMPFLTDPEDIYNLKFDMATEPNIPSSERNARLTKLIQEYPARKTIIEANMAK